MSLQKWVVNGLEEMEDGMKYLRANVDNDKVLDWSKSAWDQFFSQLEGAIYVAATLLAVKTVFTALPWAVMGWLALIYLASCIFWFVLAMIFTTLKV